MYLILKRSLYSHFEMVVHVVECKKISNYISSYICGAFKISFFKRHRGYSTRTSETTEMGRLKLTYTNRDPSKNTPTNPARK